MNGDLELESEFAVFSPEFKDKAIGTETVRRAEFTCREFRSRRVEYRSARAAIALYLEP